VAESVVKPAGIAAGLSGLEGARSEVVGIRSVETEWQKKKETRKPGLSITSQVDKVREETPTISCLISEKMVTQDEILQQWQLRYRELCGSP
jgi:hypothetical protein